MVKILTIEDEAHLRKDICDLLELEGYEILSAENGREGLQSIYEHHPDAVICDIIMPELDGYEVLKKLRQDSTYKNLPFIFLTAKTKAEDIRIGLELGADIYLAKPFTPRELLSAVRTITA